jgi:hypothetical protein
MERSAWRLAIDVIEQWSLFLLFMDTLNSTCCFCVSPILVVVVVGWILQKHNYTILLLQLHLRSKFLKQIT